MYCSAHLKTTSWLLGTWDRSVCVATLPIPECHLGELSIEKAIPERAFALHAGWVDVRTGAMENAEGLPYVLVLSRETLSDAYGTL